MHNVSAACTNAGLSGVGLPQMGAGGADCMAVRTHFFGH